MTTELTRYNGYRYVLHKGRSFTDDADKTKAGRAWRSRMQAKRVRSISTM
jgi:hypothetical protein